MSRSIALIVLAIIGASVLATGSNSTPSWYDEIKENDNLPRNDVFKILVQHKSDQEAQKYIEMRNFHYNHASAFDHGQIKHVDICYEGSSYSLYGKRKKPIALQKYIDYYEGERVDYCKKVVELIKDQLEQWRDIDYIEDITIIEIALKVLAADGDESAKQILSNSIRIKELNNHCDNLDKARELAKFKFSEPWVQSPLVKYIREGGFDEFQRACNNDELILQAFKSQIKKLKDVISPQQLSNLKEFREKFFKKKKNLVKSIDFSDLQKNLRQFCWPIGCTLFNLKEDCENVVGACRLVNNYALPLTYKHWVSPDGSLWAFNEVDYPGTLGKSFNRIRIEAGEFEWIQTYFLCYKLIEEKDARF